MKTYANAKNIIKTIFGEYLRLDLGNIKIGANNNNDKKQAYNERTAVNRSCL